MKAIQILIETFIRAIFPPRCIACRKVIETDSYYSVCDACFSTLPFVKGRACKLCGKTAGKYEDICSSCKESKDIRVSFDEVICPCEYSGAIKKAIRSFKYHRNKKLGSFLALLIEEKLKINANLDSIDVITCVPLHKNKLRHRGYNQSEIIAEELSKRLEIPINASLLRKVRETESQSRLTRQERLDNVRGCYEAVSQELIKDKNILLVDDVITTGSTLSECSQQLKKYGAGKVMVAVAATGKSRQ